MRVLVLGNRGSRRLALFAAAAARLGLPAPRVVDYAELLDRKVDLRTHLEAGCVLRIESPGEDWETERRLLRHGIEPAARERVDPLSSRELDALCFTRGAIVRPRQWYLGFVRLLQEVRQALQAGPAVRLMAHPEDVAILFDKSACQRRFVAAGVRAPAFWEGIRSYEALREVFGGSHHRRLFVKLAHGSSAVGVMALEWQGRRVRAVTTVEMTTHHGQKRLFVSKKVRIYDRETEVADLIDALAPEKLHVEEWLPKARLDGQGFDLRVVTIAGRACHVVGRRSPSPFTNLNLGNRRVDVALLRQRLGEHWSTAMEHCERAARVFPASLCLGVDLLPRPASGQFAVLEANAFGDLLPRLLHRGRDTYEAELAALLEQGAPAPGECLP